MCPDTESIIITIIILIIIIIIIIIMTTTAAMMMVMMIVVVVIINCHQVITQWQWLFYMYTNVGKKVTREFKSGGLHEMHAVAVYRFECHI